jgi:hypothetical protein
VDGRVVGQWTIAATRGGEGAAPPLSVPVTLDQGPHTIALRSLEPATSPATADPASRDGRHLAFALAGIDLRPAP